MYDISYLLSLVYYKIILTCGLGIFCPVYASTTLQHLGDEALSNLYSYDLGHNFCFCVCENLEVTDHTHKIYNLDLIVFMANLEQEF